jgi:hypothetical protein
MCRTLFALLAIPLITASLQAQGLPAVDEVQWPYLRDHCRDILRELDAVRASLPGETVRTLQGLLDKEQADPSAAVAAVQQLLEPHCLVGVNINPESRVKAVIGGAATELRLGEPRVVLIRVHNEGGVTSALAVNGPGLVAAKHEGGWLEVTPVTRARLSGRRLEYIAFRLTAREGGKREVTLRFDVGQGTQDLGFRAEVPILFTVRDP